MRAKEKHKHTKNDKEKGTGIGSRDNSRLRELRIDYLIEDG